MGDLGVPATSIHAMTLGWSALGLDVSAILDATGLGETDLHDSDLYIESRTVTALWNTARRAWGKPALGLYTGSRVPFGAFALMDYLFSTSATVSAAWRKLVRYYALINPTSRYSVNEGAPDASVTVTVENLDLPRRAVPDDLWEYSLSVALARCRELAGGFTPQIVWLDHTCVGDAPAYRRIFGGPTEFEAGRMGFAVAPDVWTLAMKRRDHGLHRVLESHAQLMLDRIPRDKGVAQQVRRVLIKSLQDGEVAIGQVASQLGMSSRTLQRRLKEEGCAYGDVVDDLRFETAKHYLRERSLSVAEVGYLLGYSEPSAFHRAFKRWTASTPQQYRAVNVPR